MSVSDAQRLNTSNPAARGHYGYETDRSHDVAHPPTFPPNRRGAR